MRRYQMLQGVNVPNSNLPSIKITPEGRAMGAIPSWNTLLDPEYITDNKLRNRAVPATLQNNVAGDTGEFEFGTFPNGSPALMYDGVPFRSVGATNINPNRWSVFVVQRPNAGSHAREVLRTVDGTPGEGVSLRVGINNTNNRASVYTSSSDTALRLGYTPTVSYTERTVLLMVTFSVERGLTIFENGVLVASAPDDRRPLTFGFSAGEYAWHRQMAGLVGMAGLLDVDLSAAENAGYRRAIERFLMTKYGIS